MRKQSWSLLSSLILVSLIAAPGVALGPISRVSSSPAKVSAVSGSWRVKFVLSGTGEKNLIFHSRPKGVGSLLLLDTAPENKPAKAPLPALWSQTTNDRVDFSSEVELPIGTCCREMGTLILKGKFTSANSITGKAIFIASSEDSENFIGYRSLLGTFTASRMSPKD